MLLSKPFRKIGDQSLYFLESTGRAGVFLVVCLISVFKPPYELHQIGRAHV